MSKQTLIPYTFTLPSYWACYLINGDASGIDDTDKQQADNFLASNGLPMPVSCSDESYFSKHNDAGTLAGDVLDYTFLLPASLTDSPPATVASAASGKA